MKKYKPIFIGILEEEGRRTSYKFIEKFLRERGYENPYRSNKDKISFYSKGPPSLVLAHLGQEDLVHYKGLGLDMDILIHGFLKDPTNLEGLLKEDFKNCKYYILNSDDESWTRLPLRDLEAVIVSYGFNSKSSLAVSSYNEDNKLKSTISLQRELVDLKGRVIEPFEFSIETEPGGEGKIYSLMALSALALILGYREAKLEI